MENLIIGNKTFHSRLFVGTGKFSSAELMGKATAASGSELVTVALKRVELENPQDDMLSHLHLPGVNLLPNTSGARTADEAVRIARLARAMGCVERLSTSRAALSTSSSEAPSAGRTRVMPFRNSAPNTRT